MLYFDQCTVRNVGCTELGKYIRCVVVKFLNDFNFIIRFHMFLRTSKVHRSFQLPYFGPHPVLLHTETVSSRSVAERRQSSMAD